MSIAQPTHVIDDTIRKQVEYTDEHVIINVMPSSVHGTSVNSKRYEPDNYSKTIHMKQSYIIPEYFGTMYTKGPFRMSGIKYKYSIHDLKKRGTMMEHRVKGYNTESKDELLCSDV